MANALINQVMDHYKDYLAIELPDRRITREWKGRESYNNEDFKPGLFTLIYTGSKDAEDPFYGYLRLMIVGRVYCGVKATGLDVEKAEQQMEDDLRAFTETNNGTTLRILEVANSHQIEAPHGWIVATCISGPHDLHHNDLFDEGAPYEGTLQAGIVPDVGFGHEDDYMQVEDSP